MIGAVLGALTTLAGAGTIITGVVVFGAGTVSDNPAGPGREPTFLAAGGSLFVFGVAVAALGLLLLVGGVGL